MVTATAAKTKETSIPKSKVTRSKLKGLKCKECGRAFPAEALHVCDFCFGPLEADYDYAAIARVISRQRIASGPLSIWRYWDLLPVESHDIITLNEGFTPLLRASRLGKKLGLRNLFIKNDTVNPTFSFKDRVVSVAITRALELGFKTLACASTGNLAGAVSAYGAVAGMERFVFVPSNLEEGKIIGAGVYAPHVIAVEGTYDDVNRLCSEVADSYNWAFVNVNLRPYYAEGSKTLGFEVAEQLGWVAPDQVIVPVASGSLLTKIYKGFKEFQDFGLIPKSRTRFNCAQAEGCSPISTALQQGTDTIRPVKPKTIAKSLAIGNPADGPYAAQIVRKTEGRGVTVTDEEIIDGIRLLAGTEGIFTETAGGVVVASLQKLVQGGFISPDEVTVAYITGNGYKTLETLKGHVGQVHQIRADLKEFNELKATLKP